MTITSHHQLAEMIAAHPIETPSPNEYVARVTFAEDFVGFEGHFPKQAIVPAACLMQLFFALLKKVSPVPYRVQFIRQFKCFRSIFPGGEVKAKLSVKGIDEVNKTLHCSGEATSQEGKVMTIEMRMIQA